jgi:O-antigen/teichoic acid export membrane protein
MTQAMSFLRDSLGMLFWRIIAILLGTLTTILLTRWLGPEDRGKLAILILSLTLTALIVQAGIPEAMIYVLGVRRYRREEVISSVFCFYFLVLIILGTFGFFILKACSDLKMVPRVCVVTMFVTTVLVTLLRHVLLAEQRFVLYSVSVVAEGGVCLISLAFLWRASLLGVDTALIAYSLSLLVVMMLLLGWFVNAGIFRFALRDINPGVMKTCMEQAAHLFVTGVGSFGVQRGIYFLLQWVSGARSVGLLSAAFTLPNMLANFPQQIATVLYSHVSRNKNVSGATGTAFRFVFYCCLVLLALLAFTAEPLAGLLFGTKFKGIGLSMELLTIGAVCFGLAGLLINSMAGLGKPRYGSISTLLNLAVLVMLGVPLIVCIGLNGAALTYMLMGWINLAFLMRTYSRETGEAIGTLFSWPKYELTSWWLNLRRQGKR